MAEEKAETKSTENKVDFIEKLRKNPWIVSTFVFGIATIVLLFLAVSPSLTGKVISTTDAGQKIVDFAESQGITAKVIEVTEDKGLYKVSLDIEGDKIDVYTTKDGQYLISGVVPLEVSGSAQADSTQKSKEVTKSDKPKVELFVMTYCPYGTQAEKGLIPVLKVLGSKIDAKIRFVHYFMHGDTEEKETYNQVCIREEQSAKFIPYLECFLEDGNSTRCLKKVGVDSSKLSSCITNKAKDYYKVDSDLSKKYGVQGSPTLIINEGEASSGRSSAAFLKTICSAFNTSPSECTQTVSSENPSPGFGYGTTGSASSASCG